ncbi:MAG: transposase, partial [Cyanobacteria bacterium J06627_3]
LSLSKTMSAISPKRGSLGAIVRSYKSSVTRHCRQNGYSHFAWQPRFYEHIIRADGSIEYIRRYIVNNPRNWQRDRNNVRKLSPPTPPTITSPSPTTFP